MLDKEEKEKMNKRSKHSPEHIQESNDDAKDQQELDEPQF
jgi:hypothetical protein